MFYFRENNVLFSKSNLKKYLDEKHVGKYTIITPYIYLLNKNDGISLYLNEYAV